MELFKARLRFVSISHEQAHGPFGDWYYRLIKHIIESDQWQIFQPFFNELNKMKANIYVRPQLGLEYESKMNEIE